MAGTRYVRDEILIQGIELSASPTVIQHDLPGGVVQSNAYSIKWLQNALDMFHRKYPFSADIQSTNMLLRANNSVIVLASDNSKVLPIDFMLDVRNGLLAFPTATTGFRLIRQSFQYFLSNQLASQGTNLAQSPRTYAIFNNTINVTPLISVNMNLQLFYYALPAPLGPSDSPNFPDEFTLIEFVRLKALEWTRTIDPGTAQQYMTKQLASLRSSGLLNEPEYEDGVPIENNQSFNDSNVFNRNQWMGNFAI